MTESLLPEPTRALKAEADRRGEDRHRCFPRRLVRLLVRPSFRCLPALVADAAADGLGLLMDDRLEVGDVLALEVKAWERGKTQIRSATVIHCTSRPDGFWLVGCRLTNPFTDAELGFLRGEGRPPRP